jgi:hypothetical protein
MTLLQPRLLAVTNWGLVGCLSGFSLGCAVALAALRWFIAPGDPENIDVIPRFAFIPLSGMGIGALMGTTAGLRWTRNSGN